MYRHLARELWRVRYHCSIRLTSGTHIRYMCLELTIGWQLAALGGVHRAGEACHHVARAGKPHLGLGLAGRQAGHTRTRREACGRGSTCSDTPMNLHCQPLTLIALSSIQPSSFNRSQHSAVLNEALLPLCHTLRCRKQLLSSCARAVVQAFERTENWFGVIRVSLCGGR